MSKCYSCKYYRIRESKCGYDGYSAYPEKECSTYKYEYDSGDCCGNCVYFSPEARRCIQNGSTKYYHERCDTYKHSRA